MGKKIIFLLALAFILSSVLTSARISECYTLTPCANINCTACGSLRTPKQFDVTFSSIIVNREEMGIGNVKVETDLGHYLPRITSDLNKKYSLAISSELNDRCQWRGNDSFHIMNSKTKKEERIDVSVVLSKSMSSPWQTTVIATYPSGVSSIFASSSSTSTCAKGTASSTIQDSWTTDAYGGKVSMTPASYLPGTCTATNADKNIIGKDSYKLIYSILAKGADTMIAKQGGVDKCYILGAKRNCTREADESKAFESEAILIDNALLCNSRITACSDPSRCVKIESTLSKICNLSIENPDSDCWKDKTKPEECIKCIKDPDNNEEGDCMITPVTSINKTCKKCNGKNTTLFPDETQAGKECNFKDSFGNDLLGDCNKVGECKPKNAAPVVTGVPKFVFLTETNNELKLTSQGNMNLNFITYNTKVSDDYTKIADLKPQLGSQRNLDMKSQTIKFNATDLSLTYSDLPKKDKFFFNVSDDGSTVVGEKKEEKSSSIEGETNWCPQVFHIQGAYDVQLTSVGDINKWTVILGFVPAYVNIFKQNEEVIKRNAKEMYADIEFQNDPKTPIRGQVNVHVSVDLPTFADKPKEMREKVTEALDAGRSKAIMDIQAEMETIIDPLPLPEKEVAKWGCVDWGTYPLDENNPKTNTPPYVLAVCKKYESSLMEFDFVYDFETEKLTISGGSGNKTGKAEMPVSKQQFYSILEKMKDLEPSAIKKGKVKVGQKYQHDYNLADSGYVSPTAFVEKLKILLRMCTNEKTPPASQPTSGTTQKVSKDTTTKKITATGLPSYYYIQDPLYSSKEGNAIKISFSPVSITKIFNYNSADFEDENFIELYRYEDGDIERNCKINILDEKEFSVSSSGGEFETPEVKIIIPENAVSEETPLKISKVNVYDCDLSVKDIIPKLRWFVNGNSDTSPNVIKRIKEVLFS